MIIAVPAVTKYINDSRQNSYIDIAKNMVNGARNLVHSGSLNMFDDDTTYYIEGKCIKTENGFKSPYGDFVKAYVVITVKDSGDGYDYYWTSVDETGTGVKNLINAERLDVKNIENDINVNDITTNRGIDERSKIVVIGGNDCTEGTPTGAEIDINGLTGKKNVLCQRATTLHTAVCERESGKCAANVGNGSTITYGTIPGDTLKPGDAFDCDVNNDKRYDPETERFYYITSEDNNAVLIYYNNMNNSTSSYDTASKNCYGPRVAYQYLPNISEWSNSKLILPGTRQILSDTGTTSTSGGTIEEFTYTNKAARFITHQEIKVACNTLEPRSYGTLNKCLFLTENMYYYTHDGSDRDGYWTETPTATSSSGVFGVSLYDINVSSMSGNFSPSYFAVRPVITTKLSNLE